MTATQLIYNGLAQQAGATNDQNFHGFFHSMNIVIVSVRRRQNCRRVIAGLDRRSRINPCNECSALARMLALC